MHCVLFPWKENTFLWAFCVLNILVLLQMVMEIPETVISTGQVNEYELQSFNKVSFSLALFRNLYPSCQVFKENLYLLGRTPRAEVVLSR